MDSFLNDISQALTDKEKVVVNISNIVVSHLRSQCNRLFCKIFSKRGHNPKQFFNFVTRNWTGRFPVQSSTYDTDVYMITFGCQDREKGKSIMASSTTQSEFSSFAPAFATLSCDIGNNSTKGDSSVVKVISEKSVTTTVSNSALKENVTPLKRTMNNHCPETSGV
ncbi:hypothetical protein CsatA_026243 [Cannabis sativa]